MAITKTYEKTLVGGGGGSGGTSSNAPDLTGISATASGIGPFGFTLTAIQGSPNGDAFTDIGFVVYPQGNAGTNIGDAGVIKITHANTTDDPYSDIVDGLDPTSNYCYKPYAKNNFGTSYGDEVCSTTSTASDVWRSRTLNFVEPPYNSIVPEAISYDAVTDRLRMVEKISDTVVRYHEFEYSTLNPVEMKTFNIPSGTFPGIQYMAMYLDKVDNNLYIFGSTKTAVISYTSASGSTMTIKPTANAISSSQSIEGARAIRIGGKIYIKAVVSGVGERLEVYNISADSRSNKGDPVGGSGIRGLCTDGTDLFIIGNGSSSSPFVKYDVSANSFSSLPAISGNHGGAELQFVGTKLCSDTYNFANYDIRIFDFGSNTWTSSSVATAPNGVRVVAQGDPFSDRIVFIRPGNNVRIDEYFPA